MLGTQVEQWYGHQIRNPRERATNLDSADTVAVTNVFGATSGAPSDPRVGEPFPALAHPADAAGRHAGHKGV